MAKPPARNSDFTLGCGSLFAPPPVLPGEDPAAYDSLLARISGTVNPSDTIEEMWLHDIAASTWEILRWRRAKSDVIRGNMHRGMRTVLESLCSYDEAEKLSSDWAIRAPQAMKTIEKMLASADLSMDEVVAETIAIKIGDIERLDRLAMHAEARRNSTLRDIDRRRASQGQAMRRAIEDVEDADFVEIKPAQIKNGKDA